MKAHYRAMALALGALCLCLVGAQDEEEILPPAPPPEESELAPPAPPMPKEEEISMPTEEEISVPIEEIRDDSITLAPPKEARRNQEDDTSTITTTTSVVPHYVLEPGETLWDAVYPTGRMCDGDQCGYESLVDDRETCQTIAKSLGHSIYQYMQGVAHRSKCGTMPSCTEPSKAGGWRIFANKSAAPQLASSLRYTFEIIKDAEPIKDANDTEI